MILGKYSFGIGDRFGYQGKAQLQAIIKAKEQGVNITPVWNKSHREHTMVKTEPMDVRTEADEAVKALGWNDSYYVDADHIGLKNVDIFIDSSDFFTLDVADFINNPTDENEATAFINKYKKYIGSFEIPGIDKTFDITEEQLEAAAWKFLLAIKEAGKIYHHIEAAKGADNFVTEISMDETDQPQTPIELFFILGAIADEGIPAQTVAPKFIGRFHKGVDCAGDIAKFVKGFEENLAVIAFVTKEFSLPENLKLSVHSGSDKFSLYGSMNKALKKFDTGLHIKTAGTTWLEELAGLAIADGEGLLIAKQVYTKALSRFDELCGPYTAVIDIDKDKLPTVEIVEKWSGVEFAGVLRHDESCDKYNRSFRQLLHVAYKIAAEMGDDFLSALEKNEKNIARNVTENIFKRHIMPIFAG
ncbi:MAG: tagaturonate epimerase family protein [Sedimentisphaerales bacterium]